MSILVLDRTADLAGAYCVHLLAGAGAVVVRDEVAPSRLSPTLASVLRHPMANQQQGRLVVVADDLTLPRAIVPEDSIEVIITAFGSTGPWAGVPANDFTLQAWCGSTGGRGDPEQPPVQAAGHLLEWAAGTYAAVAALAALRRPGSAQVDVSVLEAGVLVANMYSYLAASFGDEEAGASRSVEVPSILPARDGYVGVCTVTAQQFEDFLVMIERPDLLADEELRVASARFRRRKEFLAAVHAWSQERTVEEVLDLALAFRVPAAPVLAGTAPLEVDHFVERQVFTERADRLRLPRAPYRVTPGPARPEPEPEPEPATNRPLAGIRVIDLTAFLAGPAATHVLAALGADVVKIESPRRPDGMRGATTRRSAADWQEWGMVFHGVNTGKRGVALDLSDERGREALLRLVADADVIIENFTPRVLDNLRLTYDDLRLANPSIVLVRMPAYGLDGPWRDRSGFAQNMEQVSGLAARTGHPGEHPILPRGPCDPIAGMHAVVALLDVLRRGHGGVIEVPMVEAILNVAVEGLVEAQLTGHPPERLGNRSIERAPQGVYGPDRDGTWLALSVEDDEQWEAARRVLRLDVRQLTCPSLDARQAAHDELDEAISEVVRRSVVPDLVAELLASGVPAAPVVLPRDAASHPQLTARHFLEELVHPVVGRHRFPTVPFRITPPAGPVLTRPAPVLGEHTTEVLRAAEFTDTEIDLLRSSGTIATPPTR